MGTFYRPPNSDTAFGLFKDHISFLSPTILRNLILVSDFNIDLLKSSSLSKFLIDFTNCLGLNQIICEPTHFSHTGSPSLIDLVFVPSDLSCPSRVLPPISSSDHLSILFSLPLVRKDPDPRQTNGSKVWLYNKADFHSANLLLSSIPWKSLLSQNDVNYSWLIFKEIFLDVMKRTIPSKLVFHHKSPPWSNDHLLACIKRRHRLFSLAKQTRSSFLMSLYRSCRNKTLSYQWSLKAAFFNRLSIGSKSFWSLLHKLKMKPVILNFTYNGLSVSTPTSKANFLNDFFCRRFSSSTPPLSNANISLSPISSICPPDLLCSPTDIQHLISHLPSRTSSGPDGISATMLKIQPFLYLNLLQ